MSFQPPSQSVRRDSQPRWSGAAVLVESMLLLVFLIASLAVLTQMFSASLARAEQSRNLTAAVALAEDAAEHFAAYPARAEGVQTVDGLVVVCEVQDEPYRSGTLYRAQISVYPADAGASAAGDAGASGNAGASDAERGLVGPEPIYSLSTSCFERGES